MRIRTADPLHAKQVLYQLSYIPKGAGLDSTQGLAALSKHLGAPRKAGAAGKPSEASFSTGGGGI
uniref:Uncharacterized protein n=1 Tax=mine drainage metagenome TaxID=410659 RepID=E6Q3D9_9ZZZZ